MRRIWRIAARPAGDEQRSPGRTGIAEVSVRKVAPLPVQSVTAARGLSPDPGPPASLWDWLARLPDPPDRRGARLPLPRAFSGADAPPPGRGGAFPPAAGES